ncbi:hypothetical protein JXA32_04520 [Candidatus Sumerlaeota bacterium]|nr:hypothetical protein [Candidatus Sumerlaeota bacterium]
MNEVTILRILYKNKLRIAATALLIGIITAGLSLLLPDIYGATSALMISEPQVPITGEFPPMTVESLQNLAKSTRVKAELFKEIKASGALPPQTAFRDFDQMLSVSAERQLGRTPSYIPIVLLSVSSKDPDLCAAVANKWSDIVLSHASSIYTSGVDDLNSFIGKIYKQANDSLLKTESDLTSKSLEVNLAVSESKLEEYKTIHTRIYAERLALNEEVNLKQNVIQELKQQIEGMEINGSWAGEAFNQELRQNPGITPSALTTETLRIFQTVRQILINEDKLADFEEQSELQFMRMELKNKESQLAHIAEEIVQTRNKLAKAVTQYDTMRTELDKIDPVITLEKAITDDAIWAAQLQEKALPTGILKSQEVNSVYQDLQKQVVLIASDIKGLQGQVDYFTSQTSILKDDIGKLSRSIMQKDAERKTLLSSITKDRELLQFLETEYNKRRQQLETLESEYLLARAQSRSKEQDLNELETEIQKLERHIFYSKNTLDALQRDVENLTQVRATLASKAEEVSLLHTASQNLSRSGVVPLFGAERNDGKIKPSRSKITLGAMAAALLLTCIVLIMNAIVREN